MARTRAARPVSLGVQPDCTPGYSRRVSGPRTPRRDPCARAARESLRERATRAVPDGCWNGRRGARGWWSVSLQSAALARARGYLGPGPCAGGVQPVLKPVIALGGVENAADRARMVQQRRAGVSTRHFEAMSRRGRVHDAREGVARAERGAAHSIAAAGAARATAGRGSRWWRGSWTASW